MLLCKDSAPPHMLYTECAVVGDAPERAQVRIAHLSPDAPAVDVCLAKTGTDAWQGPRLGALGAATGLPYSKIIVPISAKLTVNDATLFAVTVEKPGGVVVSSRERIVVTAARKT